MRKQLFAIVALGSITTVAVFAYETFVTRRLAERMGVEFASIEATYIQISRTQIPALRAAIAEPTSAQLAVLQTAESLPMSSSDAELIVRLNAVNRAQRVLREAAATLAEDPAVLALPEAVSLLDAVGEQGEVRALITAYNTSARTWNTKATSMVGSLVASVSGEERPQLPYLRFDGELEAGQQVQFGT